MKTKLSLFMMAILTSELWAGEIGFQKDINGNIYNNSPITVACEGIEELKLEKYDLDNNQPTNGILNNINIGGILFYKPEPASLTTYNRLEFHLKNGYTHEDTGNCWLVLDEDKALDTNEDSIPDTPYDLNNDGDFNDLWIVGYTPDIVGETDTIEFIISINGQILPNNSTLFIACQDLSNSENNINDVDNDDLQNANFNPEYNLILNLNPQDENDEICIEAKGFDIFGNSIPNLDSQEKCFINFECQFNLEMKPVVTLINIYQDSESKQFINNTSNLLNSTQNAELNASGGVIRIENDKDNKIDDYIDLDKNPAEFHLDIYSDRYACSNDTTYSNHDYQALDFNRFFLDGNGNETAAGTYQHFFSEGNSGQSGLNGACQLDITVTESIEDTNSIKLAHGTVWEDDIYMGVDGDTPLRFVRWQLDGYLTILGNTITIKSKNATKNPAKFFQKWEQNGATFFMPWVQSTNGVVIKFALNNPTYTTYHKVMDPPYDYDNTPHAKPGAEVRAKIWDECGNYVDNVLVGYITDQGGLVVRGKDLWNLAKAHGWTPSDSCKTINQNPNLYPDDNPALMDPAKMGRFSAIFRVGAPERDVEASAFQVSKYGQKRIPIYESKKRIDILKNWVDYKDLSRN